MKFLLSLTVLCLTLALAHGTCLLSVPEPKLRNGKLVMPRGCTDPFDNSLHPFGSEWNTAQCMHCECSRSLMNCCARYGGIAEIPGCKGVVDPVTCEYIFYKMDNPSELCPFQK